MKTSEFAMGMGTQRARFRTPSIKIIVAVSWLGARFRECN